MYFNDNSPVYTTPTGNTIRYYQVTDKRDDVIHFHGIDQFIAAATFYQQQLKTKSNLPVVDQYGNTDIDRDD